MNPSLVDPKSQNRNDISDQKEMSRYGTSNHQSSGVNLPNLSGVSSHRDSSRAQSTKLKANRNVIRIQYTNGDTYEGNINPMK